MDAEEEAGYAAYFAYQEEEHRRLTRLLIARATWHPSAIDTDWYPQRWWRRIAYLVKGWVCVILDLRPDYSVLGSYPPKVELAHDYHTTYGGYDLQVLEVGKGLLGGWWYDILDDGEWFI